jgi:phosphodiesterase/alkaline phosphatase D-like protein
VILLIVLLIGLGFLTYKYTPLYGTMMGFFKSSTSGGTTTSTDTTKPVFSKGPTATPGPTSARIDWETNEPASTQVEYGKTKESTSLSPAQPADDPTALDAEGKPTSIGVLPHAVTLSGLESDTTYYYRVKSKDKAGNEAISDWKSFNTTIPESAPQE